MADSIETKAPKRGRWLRRLAYVVGTLVVLLVVLYFVGTSGGFVKGVILPKVGAAMNAEVTASDAQVSPFSHVVFHDFKLKPNGAETLLTAQTVEARYSLWSILHGKIAVEQVLVENPSITLVQNADGTSNLDPLTKSQPKKAESSKPPSGAKPSAPPNIDIKSIAMKNGTIRQTTMLKGGGQEVRELTGANLTLTDVKNDFSGKLDFSSALGLKNTGGTNAGNLAGVIESHSTFSFTKDFKPASINGKTTLTVAKADGAFGELANIGTTLDCDATPTRVNQIAVRFSQSGQPLGEVTVAGPFDAEKTEGKLVATVSSIDRRVLNLLGAANGMDFGTTTINSTNEIELAKGGNQIGVVGRLNIARFQVKKQGQTTPTLDLHSEYGVTLDRAAQVAVLKKFELTGIQDSRPLLDGKLTQPMNISLGGTAASAGDAALNLTLSELKLADWRAFAPDLEPAGVVNAKLKVLSQANTIAVDIAGKIAGLSAKFGETPVNSLNAQLQGHLISQNQAFTGKMALTDLSGSYGTYKFANYGVTTDFDVSKKDSVIDIRKATGELREGANPGGKFDIAGNFDSARKSGKFDVKLVGLNQNGLRPLLESMMGDKKLVSVSVDSTTTASIEANGSMTVKSDSKLANLVVKDPTGTLPTTPLEARVQMGTSVAKQVAQIRQCELTLTPTERAKNNMNLTGSVDLSKSNAITGNLKLAAESLDVTRYYDLFASKPQTTSTAPGKTPPTQPAPPSKPVEKEPDAVHFPLKDFVCDVNVGKFYLREVEAADLKTSAKVDGGHVLLKPFQLTLNGAPVKTDLDLDLGVPGFRYDVAFSAQGVPIAPFVNTFQPERKGQVAGLFTANAQIKGAGITGAGLQKNLAGSFSVLTTNINLAVDNIRNPIITSILNVIIGIPELLKNPTGAVGNWVGRLAGQPNKQDGWMNEISGAPINVIMVDGAANNGVIKLQKSEVSSSAFRAQAVGDVSLAPVLNDSKINIPVDVALSRSLAGKIGFKSSDTNAVYVSLPKFVTEEGTVGKPKSKIDYLKVGEIALKTGGGVVKGIGGAGGEKIGALINALGGGKAASGTNQPSATSTNQSSEGVGNLIRGVGGLLGGKKQKDTNQPAPPK